MSRKLNMEDYLNIYIALDERHSALGNPYHLPEINHACGVNPLLHVPQPNDVYQGELGEHLAFARDMGWGNPFSAKNRLAGFYTAIEELGYQKWYAYTWQEGRDLELSSKLQQYFDEDGISPDTFQLSGYGDGGYSFTFFVSDLHLPLRYHRLPYKFEECDPDKNHYGDVNVRELLVSPQTRRRLVAFRSRYLRNAAEWWEGYSSGVLYSSIPKDTPKQVIFAAYLKMDPLLRLLNADIGECLETISSFEFLNKEDLRKLRYAIKAQNADVSNWQYVTTYIGTPGELARFDAKSGNYQSYDFNNWALSLKKPNHAETEQPAFTDKLATFSPTCLR